MVFFKRVLYFFDPEHTVTYFLNHQRMLVLVTNLLSVDVFQLKNNRFGGKWHHHYVTTHSHIMNQNIDL